MKFWVGVTDNKWFHFLRDHQPDELNFWQPSGQPAFADLPSGAPFLFKLKKPNNHIAGGGFFVKYSILPLSIAWDAFGYKNGAATREEFDALIRPLTPDPKLRDPQIGCTVLRNPFFWPDQAWLHEPAGFARNIVKGRYYDSEEQAGQQLWEQVNARLLGAAEGQFQIRAGEAERYGAPYLIEPRLGQGAFRVLVTDAYKRRCAVTGESTLPVLEAAHILPFAEQGPHAIANGLLLRSDFHKLFDLGYITIDADLKIKVSKRIQEDWFNGKAYYRLQGERLANLPDDTRQHPDREYLKWHNENRYQS
jgi:putative restriction endonuclease